MDLACHHVDDRTLADGLDEGRGLIRLPLRGMVTGALEISLRRQSRPVACAEIHCTDEIS